MDFTEKESEYLDCLARGMTFEEMAVELDMTVKMVEEFGDDLFDRIFKARARGIM